MKRTKNVARLLTLVLVLCMVLIPLTSCKKVQNVNGYCKVVIVTVPETVYTVDLDKVGTVDNGLITIFEYLKENESGFTYEAQEGAYGAFLTKVLTLEQAADYNPYIVLYTSVEADFDTSEFAVEKTYNGTKLVTSGVGASSMTIQADAVYYITLSSNQ